MVVAAVVAAAHCSACGFEACYAHFVELTSGVAVYSARYSELECSDGAGFEKIVGV